jgi:hypothetical protein
VPTKIHYEDNLFFLHSLLRTLDAGMRLDIDEELFGDKILEDIFFIHSAVSRVTSALRDHAHLIRRTGYLRSLRRTVAAYVAFLERLLEKPAGDSSLLESSKDRIESTLAVHQATIREIDSLLDQIEPDTETDSIVSSEEFNFLLAEEPDDTRSAES